jgi:membrane fusion protein (multidrug efflux system)
VRVCLNPEEIKKYPLRLGLSMDVKVDLHDQFGKMVPDPIAEKPIYETDIFTGQLEDSDQIVKEIIEANSNFTFATEKDE